MRTFLSLSFSVLLTAQVSASLLVSYAFDADNGGPTVVTGGLSATTASFGTGLTGLSFAGSGYRAEGWTTELFKGSDDFIAFTVNAVAGSTFSAVNLSFDYDLQNDNSPRKFDVSYQIGTGAIVDFGTGSFTHSSSGFQTVSMAFPNGPALEGLTSLTIYVYGYEAKNRNQYLEFDNIEFSGSVVPEPSALLPFGALGMGLVMLRRRRG